MVAVRRTPKIFGSSYQPPTPKRSVPKIGQSWKAIVAVILLLVAVILVSRLPVFRIKSVELVGDQDPAVLEGLAKLKGEPIFSHPVTSFVDQVQNQLSVAAFTCRRGLPSDLRCNLVQRQPVVVWQSGNLAYLVDQNGRIYTEKKTDQPGLMVINDLKQQPVKLGQVIASPEVINSYQTLIKALKDKQLAVTGLELNESLFQVTAIIARPDHPSIKALFILTGDLGSQVASLAATLEQKGSAVTTSVDLRVPGYAYVK